VKKGTHIVNRALINMGYDSKYSWCLFESYMSQISRLLLVAVSGVSTLRLVVSFWKKIGEHPFGDTPPTTPYVAWGNFVHL
jgi:hypothetical protein